MATHSSILALEWENPTERGAWWATAHGVTKRQTRLSDSQEQEGAGQEEEAALAVWPWSPDSLFIQKCLRSTVCADTTWLPRQTGSWGQGRKAESSKAGAPVRPAGSTGWEGQTSGLEVTHRCRDVP